MFSTSYFLPLHLVQRHNALEEDVQKPKKENENASAKKTELAGLILVASDKVYIAFSVYHIKVIFSKCIFRVFKMLFWP